MLHSCIAKQIILSSKLGDGCFESTGCKNSENYALQLTSYNLDYLTFKRDFLLKSNFKVSKYYTVNSGYKENSSGKYFRVQSSELINEIGRMSVSEVLKELSKFGLGLYYFDDGSLHKNKMFGHIYCNTFNAEEVDLLIDIFYKHFPVKVCRKRFDRKKDGRIYPYIYIPVSTMNYFRNYLFDVFIKQYGLYSMEYKIGLPSQTIENLR